MDFLNNAYAQISDLFRSMTVGARITAGLLLAVVVVSLSWLFQHQVAGGGIDLLGGQSFSSSELNAMQGAFAQAGLNDFEVQGTRIRIPRNQQAAYVAALADAKALPAHWNQYLARALESNSPFITQKEREDRLRIATQQELSLVLKNMPDVDNATVHYDSQKKGGFNQERLATASVVLKMVGNRPLDEERVQMIREMVAGYFAGLPPDKVIVSDLSGRAYSTASGDGLGGSGGNHPYFRTQAAAQKHYQQWIQNSLAFVPGVVVSVNVELEKTFRTSTHSTKHDPKTAPIGIREESTTIKSESAPRGGSPGLTQQGPQPNTSVRLGESAKGSTNEEERSSREERNAVNSESTEVVGLGLTPKRVTVSVGVPDSYFEDIWRRRNPTLADQPVDAKALADIETDEKKKIQDHVVPLIPKPSDVIDPTPLVTVTKFTAIPAEAIPAPSSATVALGWFGENWQTLGLVGLVAASLLMVRSMIRATPQEARSFDISLPSVPPPAATEDKPKVEVAGDASKSRLKRRSTSGKSLRDELTDMVKEDPDTAANILRGWIGSGN